MTVSRAASALLAALFACATLPALALGQKSFVANALSPGSVALVQEGRAAPLHVDAADHAGVIRAAGDLQADIERVSSLRPELRKRGEPAGADVVIIGTLGKSALIDRLVKAGTLDVSGIRGKWEGYLVQAVARPLPGVERALVIAGADKRGTIFGIYEVSEQIGVSPWYWWADVPVKRRASLFIAPGTRVADAPVVQYRGIFLNDEEPALTGWAKEKYGGYNHKFYERVFELILRLRGNYLWPAMWNSAFYKDDPENGRLADEYGIVMSTSHHEPMMRAHFEWRKNGRGPWDYDRNEKVLRDFWRGGLRETRDFEKVVTLGMRGDGDTPMSADANVALLERIVADQRRIIGEELNRDVTKVPQVWALYKEVQEYYERGMRVPDDVLLLWCDDNWGNNRRLPTPEERKRPGGAGVYYHFDYVGSPRSYKWVNVTPLPKIWEQMHLAWKYEATRLWIVNVGDLKPMEVPTEFFLAYAWNPANWPADRLQEFLRLWAAREFGPEHAADIADLVAKYTKYNGRRKPEMLDPATYSLVNYGEADRIVDEYNAIAARAEKIGAGLPASHRDAFYQLVLYPVKAGAVVNELLATAGFNRLYATQGRASTNDYAAHARKLFALDAELVRRFHEDIAGGKWNHMMSQTHLGYTYWNQPPRNTMPAVTEVQVPKAADMGVAVEGSADAWPGRGVGKLTLPVLDVFERQPRTLEVFNRGAEPFRYAITASAPWITLTPAAGLVERDQRVVVDARWDEVPDGTTEAMLTVSGPGERKVTVLVPIHKPAAKPARLRFIETQGVVSMEPEHYSRSISVTNRGWFLVPDHGRTLSGMTTMPVEGPAASLADGVRLEFDVHLFTAGKMTVHVALAPTQKFQPGPGLRYAVSFGDEAPQVVNLHADESRVTWGKQVADGVSQFSTEHTVAAGPRTLKFWALDPGVVVQKIVIDAGGLKPSYLGPPESPRIP
ncbi:glycosyl hydrolase [Betaproteobacteria bacterium GR16-43]|nr:glycosyl hydrolase [Betaproteobacteria bacterium GR16-43]